MKFNIIKASVIYGGGTSLPPFRVIREKVSEDYVQGFFENIPVNSEFKTPEDSMGCYDIYRIEVVSLE